MYRNYAWLPAAALLAFFAAACSDTTTSPNMLAPDGAAMDMEAASLQTVYWQGHGSEWIDGCVTGYHWIAAPAGGIASVPQFFSSIPADNDVPMFRPSGNNEPGNAAWHYNSGLVDTDEGVTPYITFYGDASKVKLIISHCLDDETELEGELTVTKTADTEFTRTHDWAIKKKVTTENGHELEDGTPKIWLYTDGSGDETATWKVKVKYLGSEDTDGIVKGTITIDNTGDLVAQINSVEDVLSIPGVNVTVDCGVDLEGGYVLPVGEQLVCTYESDPFDPEDGTNTVTVSGDFLGEDGEEPFEEEDSENFTFDEPTDEFFACVHVVDTNAGFALAYGNGEGVELCAEDYEVGDKEIFTYSEDFAYEDYGDENCGAHPYPNTATIEELDKDASALLKVNVQCIEWESAWAMGVGEGVTAHPFCDNGFSNWGWSNEIERDYGPASWPVYAGAAQCDPSKGDLVGVFNITHDGVGFSGVFDIDAGYLIEGEAVYADEGMFPLRRNGSPTVAPGQYYIASPLADLIHVIAHINVGVPDPNFGP